MCAVDCEESSGAVEEAAPPSDQSVASSSLSSVAEDEELVVSDPERLSSPSSASSKVKMMCSHGGRILPRPQDGQLRYVSGETRILVVKKGISFADLSGKLSRLAKRGVVMKYQLPHEDLDALISVTSDEDLENMVDEYEKMESRAAGEGAARLRVFLFPSVPRNPFVVSDSDDESRSPPRVKPRSSPMKGHLNHLLQPQNHLEEFGSLRAYQLKNHSGPELLQQEIHEGSGRGFVNEMHHPGFNHQKHHHLESCGCRAPCRKCWDSFQFSNPMMLPPRPQHQHRLNPYQINHPQAQQQQVHHHPYPQVPHYSHQQIHHPIRPGIHEQIYKPEIKPDKFCFDRFYYKQPHSQQQQL